MASTAVSSLILSPCVKPPSPPHPPPSPSSASVPLACSPTLGGGEGKRRRARETERPAKRTGHPRGWPVRFDRRRRNRWTRHDDRLPGGSPLPIARCICTATAAQAMSHHEMAKARKVEISGIQRSVAPCLLFRGFVLSAFRDDEMGGRGMERHCYSCKRSDSGFLSASAQSPPPTETHHCSGHIVDIGGR